LLIPIAILAVPRFVVLNPDRRKADKEPSNAEKMPLQLLLFVDDRSNYQETTQAVRSYLQDLRKKHDFELQIIEIGKQPHLVEHFRLVATPALVKIHPLPRQTLAGSDLVAQIDKWWFYWLDTVSPDSDEEQKLDGTENIFNDNFNCSAELIRLTDELFRLQKEKEELQEQLNFKDQVLAMLVHDLRSPLTAASLSVETLEISFSQEYSERIEKLREKLFSQAREQFRLMNRTIGDILQASKNSISEMHLEPRKIYLQSLCRGIIQQIEPYLKIESLQFVRDIPEDLPPVYADEELIRQVTLNLLDNAIKYTPEGGKIGLSILHRTSQKLQISISDTGPGIPDDTKDLIFDPSFRLQRDEEKEGYGLGLSLCRKVIRAHYGQIWVDDLPSGGSCFHFTLPVYR
jgi:two-component system, OmpR family, clock-associated histidine kinase SasA